MISMFLGERAAQPYQASRETKDGDTNKVAGCYDKSGMSSNASTGEYRPTSSLRIFSLANKSDVTLLFPNLKNKNYSHSSSCGLFVLKFMELWTGSRLSTVFTHVPFNVQIICTNLCPILHYKLTTISIGNAQKDITNFRLKLAVTIVDYPWNKEKGGPRYKSTDAEETYKLEDVER